MGDDAIALISTFYEDCPHNLHLLFAFMERFRHVLEDEEGVVSFHNLPLEETINIFKNFESLRRDENHGRDSFKMTKGSFNEMCECSHHITFGELAEVVSDNAVMCQEELTRLDLENFKKGRY